MFNIRPLLLLSLRDAAHRFNSRGLRQTLKRIKPKYDTDYLTNPANFDCIKSNIINRKGVGDIEKVHSLVNKLNQTTDASVRDNVQHQLEAALNTIPNKTHPDVVDYGDCPKEIASVGSKRNFEFVAKSFDELCSHLNILRTNDMDLYNGARAYYFMNDLSEMVSSFAVNLW